MGALLRLMASPSIGAQRKVGAFFGDEPARQRPGAAFALSPVAAGAASTSHTTGHSALVTPSSGLAPPSGNAREKPPHAHRLLQVAGGGGALSPGAVSLRSPCSCVSRVVSTVEAPDHSTVVVVSSEDPALAAELRSRRALVVGVALLALSQLVGAFNAVATRVGVRQVDPFVFAWYRSTIATVVLWAMARAVEGPRTDVYTKREVGCAARPRRMRARGACLAAAARSQSRASSLCCIRCAR
jgi:hypothetical protein